MICPGCGSIKEPIYIHGHYICPVCHQIPEFGDCCQGDQQEECRDAKDPDDQT